MPSTSAEISILLAGPAGKPPAGIAPGSTASESLQPWIYLGLSIWMTVATLAVAARLVTQWVMNKMFHAEDYMILLAWLAQLGELVTGILCARHGIGKHMWDISLASFIQAQYYSNINSALYDLTMLGLKVALLLQFLHIFNANPRLSPFLYYGSWSWILVIVVFYGLMFVLGLAQCTPREKIWNPFIQDGSCLDYRLLFEATGVFNVVSDFAILILPMPTIYGLQCSWLKKLGIGAVFATGSFGCIVSIMRTVYTWLLFQSLHDVSWDITYTGFWTWAECCTGTLVFCLPVLPKSFKLLQEVFSNTMRRAIRSASAPGSAPMDMATVSDAKAKLPRSVFAHMGVSLASWEHPESDAQDSSMDIVRQGSSISSFGSAIGLRSSEDSS